MLRYEQLLAYRAPVAELSVSAREMLLYALAVGAGTDLPDPSARAFVYEKGLRPLSTFYTIMAWHNPSWLRDLGVDVAAMIHVGEVLQIVSAPPVDSTAIVSARVAEVFDKGPRRGAILRIESTISDKTSGEVMARSSSDLYFRGNGGIEGVPAVRNAPHEEPIPDGVPSGRIVITTRADQAALYRLCGDMNPLHIDPGIAARSGFDRPILHGLCTYGMAYVALVRRCLDGGTAPIRQYDMRFCAPLFPGECLDLDFWQEPDRLRFRASVGEQRVVAVGTAYI